MTLSTWIAGSSFLLALIIGVPGIIGWIFFSTGDSIYITQYIYLGYLAFFLLVLGILIPLSRWIMHVLEIRGSSPLDAIATFILPLASAVPLIFLVPATLATLGSERLKKYRYKVYHFSVSITMFLLGAWIRYHGTRKNRCFVMITHTAGIEYVAASQAMGTYPWNILAGANLSTNKKGWKNKIVAWTIGKIVDEYSISVDRGDDASRVQALKRAEEEYDAGKNIAFFPEGTRLEMLRIMQGETLGCFKSAMFKLAFKKGICMQPLVFDLAAFWCGKNDPRFGIHPCRIDAWFLEPVDPKDFETAKAFQDHCWFVMNEKMKQSKRMKQLVKRAA